MTRYLPLLALAACSNLSEPLVLAGNYRDVADVPPGPIGKINLLFVIDKSGSVANDQIAIAEQSRQALFDVLAQGRTGLLPDLHIAVISSDMGVGPYSVPNCSLSGDDGGFLVPQLPFCTGPRDAWLVDEAGPDGTRVTNYDGALEDAFGCMIRVGADGCGFEQPFAALRAALDGSHPEHAGFLRPDALLAVVLVTDEDDCSVVDERLFDGDADDLGRLTSFRCFEYGVTCEEGNNPVRAPGERHGCSSREDSAYVAPLADTVEFLNDLKDDPTLVLLVGVIGEDEPVVVAYEPENDLYHLQPSCVRGGSLSEGDAAPAVRISQLLDAFPNRSSRSSICQSVPEGLARGARAMVEVIDQLGCLSQTPRDLDPATAGLQPDCRAFDVSAPLTEAEERTPVAACATSGARRPCYELVADDSCTASGTGLRAQVRRDSPSGRHLVLNCLLD